MTKKEIVMKKIFFTCLALFALIFGSLGLTQAEAVQDLEGKGVLRAMGSGIAVVKGTMDLRLAGAGFLLVDPGEDSDCPPVIEVTGRGERIDLEDGRILFVGFHGRAHIVGSGIKIELAGADLDLFVIGSGRALLKGCGRYRTGLRSTPWNVPWAGVPFGPRSSLTDETSDGSEPVDDDTPLWPESEELVD